MLIAHFLLALFVNIYYTNLLHFNEYFLKLILFVICWSIKRQTLLVKILETYRATRINRTDILQHRFPTEAPDFHLIQCGQEPVLEPLVLFAFVCLHPPFDPLPDVRFIQLPLEPAVFDGFRWSKNVKPQSLQLGRLTIGPV